MGKILETTINRFDGGIVNDPRNDTEAVARMITNFDALTDSRRLIPYRSGEDGHDNASTETIKNFCIARRQSSNPTHSLYGLGITPGGGLAEVYYKDITTGGSNDLGDNGWTETANNAAASGGTNFDLFVFYRKTTVANSRIYGASGGTRIWSYDPTGTVAFDDDGVNVTYTNIAQGVVHPKDDILYVPYDNKIAVKNQAVAWNLTGLTLPESHYITSICPFGNYLAIATAPLSAVGDSLVYLWDRDSTLTTLSEVINWGSETLNVIGEVDGVLIGISSASGSSIRFNQRLVFKYLSVSNAIKFEELLSSTTILLLIAKQQINNRLHFMAQLTLNGAVREGVWSVGRNYRSGGFSIIHERTPDNDTAMVGGNLHNFVYVGDYLLQSYTTSGAVAMSKTNDQATYTAKSVYETKISNDGDTSLKKQLIGVTVTFENLPAAGQVVLKYKIDDESSYTTIFTEADEGEISHSAVNIESSGARLPEYKEVSFRIESTGGAVITGLSWQSEVVGKRNYGNTN